MSTALFLGRFQPVPHLGHVKVMKEILAQHEKLIVVLGSSQYGNTFENPTTTNERMKIFKSLFEDLGVSKNQYEIIPVPDIHSDDQYVDHLKQYVPDFDVVYSGNDLVQRLFREKGYFVVPLPRYFGLHGTTIREMIVKGDDAYLTHLPDVSKIYLEKLGLVKRIRGLVSRKSPLP